LPQISAVSNTAIESYSETELFDQIDDALSSILKLVHAGLPHASANSGPSWLPKLLDILARATREQPFWRPLFGHPRPTQGDNLPACILAAVADVLEQVAQTQPQALVEQDIVLHAILRIVANCCADDNISRAVVIKNGLGALKQLVKRGRALDLVLPTIYNVCVDFDQVAMDGDQKPLRIEQLDTAIQLTVAEQALGRFSHSTGVMVQTFLRCGTQVNEASLGILADLVEISSRPALFGEQEVLDTENGYILDDLRALVKDVLDSGRRIIERDEDTKGPIFQTVLNLLSQKLVQEALAQSPADILDYISLFNLLPDEDQDLKTYAESLSQMLYTISALPDFAETFKPASEAQSSLVKILHEKANPKKRCSSHELAGPIVLLANSLTTPDGIAARLSSSPNLPQLLADIIKESSSSIILVPVLDLANRLALIPEGQSAFLTWRTLAALAKKLSSPPPSSSPSTRTHTLTIHRECLTLTRLLLKPLSPPHQISNSTSSAPQSPSDPFSGAFNSLHTGILYLWLKTPDDATKLGIGRYIVARLRHTAATESNPTTPFPQLSYSAASLQSDLPLVMPPITHLLTTSTSASLRSEGVFGLGLLLAHTMTAAEPLVGEGTTAGFIWLEPLIEQREKVLAALEGQCSLGGGEAGMRHDVDDDDHREESFQERQAQLEGLDDGRGERGSDDEVSVRRIKAEEENVKMVVVQLLRALDRTGQRQREATPSAREFVESLQALAVKLGIQV
jgi:hypothetical protein